MMAARADSEGLSKSPESPQSPRSPHATAGEEPSTAAHLPPITQVPEPHSEPEEDFDDGDSAIDTTSVNHSSSISLGSSITRYREENGRRYHAYGSTEHWGPNDERAQDQQDLSHHLWLLTLNGKLYLAPIERPQSVLDLGTGTGCWAIDMADENPQAQIKGTDLSPIQPCWVPPNLIFEVDDYNLEWVDNQKYDLIHARELLGSVPDWPQMYRRIFSALKPGGWVDQAEPSIHLITDYYNLGPDHVYRQWSKLMVEASERASLAFDIGHNIKGWMEAAGFINVTEVRVPWPIGRWPQETHQREIGMFNRERLEQGIMDFCSRRFTNNLGWSYEELQVFGARMRAAVNNARLLAHQWVYFVHGQKPPVATSDGGSN